MNSSQKTAPETASHHRRGGDELKWFLKVYGSLAVINWILIGVKQPLEMTF